MRKSPTGVEGAATSYRFAIGPVTPSTLLEQYGSDGVRYWAAMGRPGIDTDFERQTKIGRRLALKLLNVSKFTLGFGGDPSGSISEALDQAMIKRLAALVDIATAALDSFEYSWAIERAETFFWSSKRARRK